MLTRTEITAYSEGTPNGLKIHIALEELELEYKVLPACSVVIFSCNWNPRDSHHAVYNH